MAIVPDPIEKNPLLKITPPSDPLIGKLLERLLDAVMAEKIRNERKELLDSRVDEFVRDMRCGETSLYGILRKYAEHKTLQQIR